MNLSRLLIPALVCTVATLSAQDPKAKAQALVREAIAFAKKSGKEALVKETNNSLGRFHVQSGETAYIFIYDMQGLCIGMGFQSKAVGTNRWDTKDPDGKLYVREFLNTVKTKGNGWVEYKKPNPKTNKLEQKASYVEGLDGWVIGCGAYK